MNSRIILVLAVAILSIAVASATDCWDPDRGVNQSACEIDANCTWINDTWAQNGGWCKDPGCWNFQSSQDCNEAAALGCSWMVGGGEWGWCEDKGCWNYNNQSSCEAENATLGCEWDLTGSFCYKRSCGEYSTQATCIAATDYKGDACRWNSEQSYCYEEGCWNFFNQTACEEDHGTYECGWDGGSMFCQEVNCHNFEYTDENTCENNAYNLSCDWNNPWCNEKGCWNLNNQSACNQKEQCYWKTGGGGGWCEKTQCWYWNNQNSSACENTSSIYGLNCVWNDPWCNENISAGCSMFNDRQRDCMDTGYCIYDFMANTCNDPTGFGGFDMDQDFTNPGCWILDKNNTRCNQIIGCFYNTTSSLCEENETAQPNIGEGIKCSYINSSDFCNKVPFLGGCCAWNGTNCNIAPMTNACRDNMQDPGEGMRFCEDYNILGSDTNCDKISGDPWYMPCKWDNSSSKCRFRMDDKGIDNIKKITNKKECQQSGSDWVQEYYCDGNNTVPFGWCEMKIGSGAKSCNQQCWACEWKDGSGNAVTSANARSTCEDSDLGYCEFISDTKAPNGIGFCKPKQEFREMGGDCNTKCSACTFIGDPLRGEPQQNCQNSPANCKWFTDPDDPTKGWCDSATKKTCAEKCSQCFTETACSETGGSNTSTHITCDWSNGLCLQDGQSQGSSEICFDGVDNDQNDRVDCDDSACASETFCGGGYMGDCQTYINNQTCSNQTNCAWIVHQDQGWCDGNSTCNEQTTQQSCNQMGCTWRPNSWCDMKGAQCWMNGQSQQQCDTIDGCVWNIPPDGGACDVNDSMSNVCMGMIENESDCVNETGRVGICEWRSGGCEPTPEHQGDPNYEYCYRLMEQIMCNGDSNCQWNTNNGFCDFKAWRCFDKSQEQCDNATYCNWAFDPMMGQYQCMPVCFGMDPPVSQDDCLNHSEGSPYTICNWRQGFCDPEGMMGNDCPDYDLDSVVCQNQTGCMWLANPSGQYCEVNETAQCWELNTTGACQANSECIVWNETGTARCEMKAWECEMNWTRQINSSLCLENSYCSWENNRCKPKCYNSTFSNLTKCGTESGCYVSEGLCESKMAAMMFGGMMGSPPVELGWGDIDEGVPSYSDIRMYGIKDDKDNYGLGIGVWSMINASICNGERLQGSVGAGENTTKFFWYLDTDGNDTNNCNATGNFTGTLTNYSGFEFKFKYVSSFESGSVSEGRTAYKCHNGEWVAAEIRLSSQKKIMCEILGGGMVAVAKSDLTSFQNLFDPMEDMRIMVSTADSSTDETSPKDSLQPAYYSHGQFDFGFEDCMYVEGDMDGDGMKAKDDPDCSFLQQFGFVIGEDCFAGTGDEDGDELENCNDPDCKGFWYCADNQLGVEAVDYQDETAPKLLYQDMTLYPDGAFIAFDTDEPTNSTLLFYANDSICTNATQNVANLSSSKIWKRNGLLLRNVTGGINFNFRNATTYNYKLRMADNSNNTAVSKCLNFTTTADTSKVKCPDCKVILNFDTIPNGWNAEMFVNGQWYRKGNLSCGMAGGMLIWYNETLHIRFIDETTHEGIEFRNVMPRTLSGTSRTVEDDDMQKGTFSKQGGGTASYVLAEKDKIDDLIDKLRPGACRVHISGNNTELWHCYNVSSPSSCKNKTTEAVKIGYNDTTDVSTWELPKCEFSAWADGRPATSSSSSSSSSSSGGGGGGGGAGGGGATPESVVFKEGMIAFEGDAGDSVRFFVKGNSHSIKILEVKADSVDVVIKSVIIIDNIKLGETKEYNLDDDLKNDISVKVESITGNKTLLVVSLLSYQPVSQSLSEEKTESESKEQKEITGESFQEPEITSEQKKEEIKNYSRIIVTSTIAALALLLMFFLIFKKTKLPNKKL